MKLKAHFEIAKNLDEKKFQKERVGGNYPHRFYPTPLWNTEHYVVEFELIQIKEVFEREKYIHNKLYKLLFITNEENRIVFMPTKFKHWMDCSMAQEELIRLAHGVAE